jgi:repressor LexA
MFANWFKDPETADVLQVYGDCMTDAGIRDGALVGVKPQTYANDGDIVVAVHGGGRLLKTYRVIDGHEWLIPQSPKYDPIPADGVTILGIVTGVLNWV